MILVYNVSNIRESIYVTQHIRTSACVNAFTTSHVHLMLAVVRFSSVNPLLDNTVVVVAVVVIIIQHTEKTMGPVKKN